MSQSPYWLTSQRCGCVNGDWPHVRSAASYWATRSASAMLTTASLFTSPQRPSSVVLVLLDVVLDVLVDVV